MVIRFPNHLVFRLCRKHAEAVKAAKDSKDDFSDLNSSADPSLVRKWADEEAEALRARDLNEASMDIFDIKICKGWWFQNHIHAFGTAVKQAGRPKPSRTSAESARGRTNI